ncbi:class I SAM-dependent methyltransferase [Pigmentibacter ruber]
MEKLKYFQEDWNEYSKVINTNFLYHTEIKEKFKLTIENYLKNCEESIIIVDFGCGDCSQIIPNLYNNRIKKFVGIDSTIAALNSAEEILKSANLKLDYELKLAKLEDCDQLFPEGSIDIIYLCYSLHHLSKYDKEEFLRSSHKKLKNNGVLFISDGILPENRNQNDWINLFESKMYEKSFSQKEIKNMIDHCKNDDNHETLSFYKKICKNLKFKKFNILFRSDLTIIFTLER